MRGHVMRFALIAALVLWAASVVAAPDFPKLTGRVTDTADMLSSATENQLTNMLANLERDNGDQIVVVTVPDIGSAGSIETYGYQLGRAWGIGQAKADNGALLLIAKKEHAIRIEVGYGLEGQLTDARSSLIIRRIIQPAFKDGDFDRGVLQGTAAMVKTVGGDPGQTGSQALADAQRADHESGRPSIGHTLMFFGLMAGIIALFGGGGGGGGPGGKRRRRRRGGMPWFIPVGGAGGFGSGGGLGGGGFSGGGGGFGGGGASGGW